MVMVLLRFFTCVLVLIAEFTDHGDDHGHDNDHQPGLVMISDRSICNELPLLQFL